MIQAGEFLLKRLCDVLALLLFPALPIAAFLPLSHPLRLLADPRSLTDVLAVVPLGSFAAPRALVRKCRPPTGVFAYPSGLCLELNDPCHPLQEHTIVRNRDDTPAVLVDKPLEEPQAVEIKVVGRLVEQQHIRAGRRDRFELTPGCLTSGTSRSVEPCSK